MNAEASIPPRSLGRSQTGRLPWLRQRPAWLPWLLLRSVSGLGTIVFISVLVFGATQALPSEPARVILGPDAPEETVRILARQLGFDRPLPEQYLAWLGRIAHGDLGRSLDSQRPVAELIGARLGNSLVLLSLVALLGAPLAIGLGVFLALRRGSALERSLLTLLIGLKAVPVFAVGLGLVALLSTSVFQLLPPASLIDHDRSLLLQPEYLALPVLTLLLTGLPYPARLVRTAMLEVLQAEYVILARLRGIPESRILLRHALPNALLPAIQGGALMLSVMLGGSLVVEVLFNFPGLGSALNAAVEVRDLPMIQALVLIVTSGVVLINLSADLLTVLLTPRLRMRGAR